MNINTITQNSKKDSDYFEYIRLIQQNFKEIPWINGIETLYSKLLFLYKESNFVSGIALFDICPEDSEITEKAKALFDDFIFASCLFTKPEYRNHGYGYELLKQAILEVKSTERKFVGIVDNDNKHLIESYKKNFTVNIFQVI